MFSFSLLLVNTTKFDTFKDYTDSNAIINAKGGIIIQNKKEEGREGGREGRGKGRREGGRERSSSNFYLLQVMVKLYAWKKISTSMINNEKLFSMSCH